MSKFNGKLLSIEIFGESHSEFIGGKVYSMPKFRVDFDKLNNFLDRRKSKNAVFSTMRREEDIPEFFGIEDSTINGDFSFTIKNSDVKSKDYKKFKGKPRPSHADYAWYLKDGITDFTGGGRFSGRLTAPFCVIGGICKQYLESLGIFIGAYVSSIGNVNGKSYKNCSIDYSEIENVSKFPSLSFQAEMEKEIEKYKNIGDSVGGRIECIVYNMKQGVGDNLFSGLEGKISELIYSVPGVKGVEFGLGFGFINKCGSTVNDGLAYNGDEVRFLSNNSGGINGGISNGEKITVGVAMRPTPSISLKQKTVDLINKRNTEIEIKGRHDACIVPRAVPVIESAVAIALTDEIGAL